MQLFNLGTKKIEELKEIVRGKDKQIYELEKKLEWEKRDSGIREQTAITDFKLTVQEKLIESDLERNEAKAKLEVYEKLDTKADANVIKETLGKLVEALGQQQKISVIK
jgi:hypothetical protein